MPEVLQGRLLAKCALPRAVLSENKFTGGHWASTSVPKHWRETKDWALLLRSVDGLGFVKTQEQFRRRVVVKRLLCLRQRRFDEVNKYGGSVKSIQDALVKLGWLTDDAPKYCDLAVQELEPDEMEQWEYDAYDKRGALSVVEVHELNEEIKS